MHASADVVVPSTDSLTSATETTARAILYEIASLPDDERDAATQTLRRALFADRLPLLSMRSAAYLVFRQALLPATEDDFGRRCDVVAVVMVARGQDRLTRALRVLLQEELRAMEPKTRRSAVQWLRGQLYDEDRSRVALDEPAALAQLLVDAG